MITDEELRQHGSSVNCVPSGNRIEIDWYREDHEWRSFRLHRVVGYIRAAAESAGNKRMLDKVARIQDHKGDLTVYWHELPDESEKTIFENAWNSEYESGDQTQHELEEELT